MTDAPASPWANHMPRPQGEHTMTPDEFTSVVAAVSDVINARVCCQQHGARVAVTVAMACLLGEHADNHDAVERDLADVCSALVESLRAGVIRLAAQ